jgi:hypothetical protein
VKSENAGAVIPNGSLLQVALEQSIKQKTEKKHNTNDCPDPLSWGRELASQPRFVFYSRFFGRVVLAVIIHSNSLALADLRW